MSKARSRRVVFATLFLTITALLSAIAVPVAVNAFTRHHHENITKECLKDQGLESIANTVAQGVRDVDVRDLEGPDGITIRPAGYEPKCHCDRSTETGTGHKDAFLECQGYFKETFEASVDSAQGPDKDYTLKMMSRWLHVQQDFFSHSNAAWEPNLAQHHDAILRCWDGSKRCLNQEPWIGLVKMTGFPSTSKNFPPIGFHTGLGRPIHDIFSHRDFALDDDNFPHARDKTVYKGEERKRFQAAQHMALEACKRAIGQFKARCPDCKL